MLDFDSIHAEVRRLNGEDPAMLDYMADDPAKWAEKFSHSASKLGASDMDQKWLASWFFSAVEAGKKAERARLAALHDEQQALLSKYLLAQSSLLTVGIIEELRKVIGGSENYIAVCLQTMLAAGFKKFTHHQDQETSHVGD